MKKTISILRWIGVMLVNAVGFITAPLIYPLLYPFRNKINKVKPFWYYFDDEDGDYGTDWFRESLSYGENKDWWSKFRVAYKWSALRNPAWNLQANLVPKKGTIKVEEIVKLNLTRNNKIIVDINEFATLKFVDVLGNFKDNIGSYLSLKYSILGKAFIWYKIDNTLYWRYSFANKVSKKFWIEIHLGTGRRYVFRLKIKKNLNVYENQ